MQQFDERKDAHTWAITIRIRNKVITLKTGVIWLQSSYQLLTRHIDNPAIILVPSVILERQKHASTAPGKLITERIVSSLQARRGMKENS
jgi:hypothetical protein